MKNNKAMKMTSREYMMKFLYQIDVTKDNMEDLEAKAELFLENNEEYIKNRYEELRLQFSNDPELDLTSETEIIDEKYVKSVCNCIKEKNEYIDEIINKYSKNWPTNRMPKVDLAILKLSVCELLAVEDVPSKVSINEAIEMAKLYCDDKAPKFINGILGSVVNELEQK